MYAIIETGGKQYKVKKGDVIDIELLTDVADKNVQFDQVLFVNDGTTIKVGQPTVKASKVLGEILDQVKGPKVVAYKYKQRKNSRRKVGHRQSYSRVRIIEITS
jgi:large subunit ribosomal protein L21